MESPTYMPTAEDVTKKGIAVLGSVSYHQRLDAPVRALGYTTPRAYLEAGMCEELLDILGRIEHGVYS